MRMDASIICQDARTRDGALDLIGLGIDTFTFDAFPATVALTLFVRVAGDGQETADLLVITRDADGTSQSETIQPVALGDRPGGLPPSCPVRGMLTLALNCTFNEPGAYTIDVSLGGSGTIDTHVLFIRAR